MKEIKLIIVLIFVGFYTIGASQKIYYQDIFHGGVTAGGFSTCMGAGSGEIEIYIEPNSKVKKAFLFTYKIGSSIPFSGIRFNQQNIKFSPYSQISPSINNFVLEAPFYNIHSVEVTSLISSNQLIYPIEIPTQFENTKECINCVYSSVFLYVQYENSSLEKVATQIILNIQENRDEIKFVTKELLPITTINDVGFSIYSDRIGADKDGTKVLIANTYMGLLGGADLVNKEFDCGVKGHFYYQNKTLFGLDDDIANNLLGGSDGIANISNIINPLDTKLAIKYLLETPNSIHSHSNYLPLYLLTYTSPCDTFSVSVPCDTTVCQGETLQLYVSGGQRYEWTAVSDTLHGLDALSCMDCPNPVFSGDSSQVYTVRIWNTDSCSVVRPVRVNVSHRQEIKTAVKNSVCELANGQIMIKEPTEEADFWGAVTPSEDTISPSSLFTFYGLVAGEYTVFYEDKYGCITDTVVKVEPIISTVAQFNAYPKSGAAPKLIELTNQSKNATDYSWWINGEYHGNDLPSYWADTSGVYTIQLIAWQNDSICADTASFTLILSDSLVAKLPNVFTPNGDGINDYFNIKINLPVYYSVSILNRWGNVVFEREGNLEKGTHNLWDGTLQNGKTVSNGTYFYTISLKLKGDFDCKLVECEVRENGFVEVVGR